MRIKSYINGLREAMSVESRIKVKILSQLPSEQWMHQFPDGEPVWGECEFLFDTGASHYDWLVVYDDVPRRPGQKRKQAREPLACPEQHTLLVTTEPSSIKIYGNAFTNQFGAVLTSQEAWALPHPGRLYAQPALHWFYGVGSREIRSFDTMEASPPQDKSRDLSMVFSPKNMRHTLHRRRHDFMCFLMERLPAMDVYGRSARALDDKAEALDDYRYHVAVENFIGPHHWTEKLADAFLGLTLPFYCGCPDAADYFPEDSFIPIDIREPEAALATILRSMAEGAYEKRLPAIIEARRRVMRDYNLFSVLAREIPALHEPGRRPKPGQTILSRHALRHGSTAVALGDIYGKVRGRVVHLGRSLLDR